jgi:hypothetical protein
MKSEKVNVIDGARVTWCAYIKNTPMIKKKQILLPEHFLVRKDWHATLLTEILNQEKEIMLRKGKITEKMTLDLASLASMANLLRLIEEIANH